MAITKILTDREATIAIDVLQKAIHDGCDNSDAVERVMDALTEADVIRFEHDKVVKPINTDFTTVSVSSKTAGGFK